MRFLGDAMKGIIPALAGNTAADEAQGPSHEDHPRSRGEYTP